MPLVGIFKGKKKTYLFSDNCQYLQSTVMVKHAPRQFHIQKFKKFVIGYSGLAPQFAKFMDRFDPDSFPEPLTKSWLMRNFYQDFIDFLVKECDAKIENQAIAECNFAIMILGKDYAYDIGDEYLYEIDDINCNGDDCIAFSLFASFGDTMDDEELLNNIMSKTVKYSSKVSYPFLLVTNDDLNHVEIINKDGSRTKEELKELWRKD